MVFEMESGEIAIYVACVKGLQAMIKAYILSCSSLKKLTHRAAAPDDLVDHLVDVDVVGLEGPPVALPPSLRRRRQRLLLTLSRTLPVICRR